MSWNFYRMVRSNRRKFGGVLIPQNIGGDPKDIQEMTNMLKDKQIKAGRAWRTAELRIKSTDDLHKLWYVLLKEKNMLRSDRMLFIQYAQIYNGYDNLRKVKLSMSRIKAVIGQRQKVREDYRKKLEQEYIAKKKQELGIEESVDPQEGLYNELKEDQDYKQEIDRIVKEKSLILTDPEKQTPLTKTDFFHYAGIQAQKSSDSFVGQYVKGGKFFNDRTYRKIILDVNRERAQAAKRLFIKELVAVGKMLAHKERASENRA